MKLRIKVKGSVRIIEISNDATIEQLKEAIVQKDDPFTISHVVAAGKELKDAFIVGKVLKPNAAVLATHVDRVVVSSPRGEPFFLAHDILGVIFGFIDLSKLRLSFVTVCSTWLDVIMYKTERFPQRYLYACGAIVDLFEVEARIPPTLRLPPATTTTSTTATTTSTPSDSSPEGASSSSSGQLVVCDCTPTRKVLWWTISEHLYILSKPYTTTMEVPHNPKQRKRWHRRRSEQEEDEDEDDDEDEEVDDNMEDEEGEDGEDDGYYQHHHYFGAAGGNRGHHSITHPQSKQAVGDDEIECIVLPTGDSEWKCTLKSVSPTDLEFVSMVATHRYLYVQCRYNLYALDTQKGIVVFHFQMGTVRGPLRRPTAHLHGAGDQQGEHDGSDGDDTTMPPRNKKLKSTGGDFYITDFSAPCFVVHSRDLLVCPSHRSLYVFSTPTVTFTIGIEIGKFLEFPPLKLQWRLNRIVRAVDDIIIFKSESSHTVALELPPNYSGKGPVVRWRIGHPVIMCGDNHLLLHNQVVECDEELAQLIRWQGNECNARKIIENKEHGYLEAVIGLAPFDRKFNQDFDVLDLDLKSKEIQHRIEEADLHIRQQQYQDTMHKLNTEWEKQAPRHTTPRGARSRGNINLFHAPPPLTDTDAQAEEEAKRKEHDEWFQARSPPNPPRRRHFDAIQTSSSRLQMCKIIDVCRSQFSSLIVLHTIARKEVKKVVQRELIPTWRCEILCGENNWSHCDMCIVGNQIYVGYIVWARNSHSTARMVVHCISVDCGIERWSAAVDTDDIIFHHGTTVRVTYHHGSVVLSCYNSWQAATMCTSPNGKKTWSRVCNNGAMVPPLEHISTTASVVC